VEKLKICAVKEINKEDTEAILLLLSDLDV